jgi:hypothetical protein
MKVWFDGKGGKMKTYRIIEGVREVNDLGEYRSVHYIECNNCEKISPFAVKVDDSVTVIFMSEILSIEIDKE